MLKSTLSALWLATLAWGAVQAEEDNVKSIGLRTHTLVQVRLPALRPWDCMSD
jgi:mannose-binding lectin 2